MIVQSSIYPPSIQSTGHLCTINPQSTDGCELREAANVPASCTWVDPRSAGLSGKDYVQFHTLRIKALPTRVRTPRGRHGDGFTLTCKAGWQSTETPAYIVQG